MQPRARGLLMPLRRAGTTARAFSSADSLFERRFRWWEKHPSSDELRNPNYTSTSKWWEQTELPEVATEKTRRETIRREVSLVRESTVRRPPPRRLPSEDEEVTTQSMTEIVQPRLQSAKTDAERAFLKSFIDKPCQIGKNFFDVEKWAGMWSRLADDFKQQKSVWEKDYKRRKAEKAKQRIREWEGVQANISQIFTARRAKELFGPDWKKINRPISGVVMKIEGNKYHVAWAVPGLRTEVVVHEGDERLDTVHVPNYVPDFDAFEFNPSHALSPEDWLDNTICEHPLLIVTDSKENPAFLRAKSLLSHAPFATVDLSVPEVPEETRSRIRKYLHEKTNWPWFPQIFVSAVFMGGIETLEEVNESGSLETVLVLAGVRQKGLVEREVDKYEQLIAEQIGEWRYKQMDKLTKSLEASDEELLRKELAPDAVELKWPDRKQREDILARLIKNQNVEELYYDDMRRKFLRESLLEIERLTQVREMNRIKHLLPEDDDRVNLNLILQALEHPYFAPETGLKREIEQLALIAETSVELPGTGRDVGVEPEDDGLQTYNLTSGPTSGNGHEGEDSFAEAESIARSALDESTDRWNATLAGIRLVNDHIQRKLGVQQRRVFHEHVTKLLDDNPKPKPGHGLKQKKKRSHPVGEEGLDEPV